MEETKCIQKGSMRQGVIDFLVYIPLFDQLEPDELEIAERYMNLVEINKDEVLFKEGEIRYNFHHEKLGTFMKEKREAMGLSLRDASRLSVVSHTHIRDIEDGRSIPSFEMVMKFLKAYMVESKRSKGELIIGTTLVNFDSCSEDG